MSSANLEMAAATSTVHAFRDDALGDLDAVGVAERLRRGEVSAREVADAALARAEAVNPLLNAVVLTDRERIRQAGRTRRTGVFADVPTFIKDNTDLKGLPTRHGSRAVSGAPAAADSAFARQYLAQGFTVIGKSTMPEFGFNASTEFAGGLPPTRNPWLLSHSSGASSGGSAALVASGVVPIAHANDGGGSIRIPAACCGLVGLKPTRGRLVDGEAARSLPVKIVSEGVVTRSVRDTAHFFAGMERIYRNPKLPPVGLVEGAASRRLRIGLVTDSITGHATDDETRQAVLDTAHLLEAQGHTVEELTLPVPPRFADDFSTYWGMLSFLAATFGKRVMGPDFDAAKLDNLSQGLAQLYRRNLHKTPLVLYRLQRSWQDYARIFDTRDVVLSPVLAHVTPELGHLSPAQPFDTLFERLLRYVSFTPLNNASGSPAMSLPLGADARGLPIGVQFSARQGDERTLLSLAYELEALRPWRRIQDLVPAL